MARDSLQYDKMVETALRGVVRQALASVIERGLPGSHHFYLTFRTTHPGVEIADRLHAQYPQDMTIVLQHQFWGLEVTDEYFVVNLSFSNIPERLKVPYAALVSFVDPSVKFGLQFQVPSDGSTKDGAADKPAAVIKEAPALALASIGGQTEPKPKADAAKGEGAKADTAKADATKNSPAKDEAAKDAGATAEGDKGSPEKVVSLDAFRKK
jgi:hypothetical protein